MSKLRLAVLISGSGSNLQSIIDTINLGQLDAEISVVISNRKNAYGLERAKNSGIKTEYVGTGNYSDEIDRTNKLLEILSENKIELIVLAGYLSILPANVINEYSRRIINIHPSLIPKYCGEGFYGERVHRAVLEAGESESGATTHFVDEGIDTGEIIIQKKVNVLTDDTTETLAARVLEVEHEILVQTIRIIIEGKVKIGGTL